MFHLITRKRSSTVIFCVIVALASMMGLRWQQQDARSGQAPDAEGRVIDRVVFEGLDSVDTLYVQGVVRITPGTVWNRDEIAAACARLAATGKFEGAPYAESREEDGLLVLVFVVHERPFIEEIDFVGNDKFKDSDLLKAIELSVGSSMSEFLINQARQDIELKYQEAGYSHAAVEVDGEILRAERRVLFRISEGPRIKVRHIEFEGNAAFSSRILRSKIETSTYIWLFRTGAFSDEQAERDTAVLKQYYVDRGYLNARVGYRVEYPKDESSLTLIFQIEEGLQHIIKSIAFEGNAFFEDESLAAIMKSSMGAPIDAEVLEADRKRILDEYGSLGYIYAEVSTPYLFDEEDGYVNLVVRLKEADQ